ncbi:nucleotidyltransferase family protein [Neisseriaceae bacterium TC5R-5]|nr:nucleotidyltransferase family protein [Neisseriaceae bacterium TC5R-5]
MKAMILAAGRGERMRPLTEHTPKPLLMVGGKALIVWQIERLAAAGFRDIVINHAWLGQQIVHALGDGRYWGVQLSYSAEVEPLETAGGIAQALPLLQQNSGSAFLCVAADIYTDYDYRRLAVHIDRLNQQTDAGMHLVMTANPPFHPQGDFGLDAHGSLQLQSVEKFTFSSIGVYDCRMFSAIAPGSFVAMRPYYQAAIAAGQASGEYFSGCWHNIGTPAQLQQLDRQLNHDR